MIGIPSASLPPQARRAMPQNKNYAKNLFHYHQQILRFIFRPHEIKYIRSFRQTHVYHDQTGGFTL